MSKLVLLGDEAIGQGALDAGLSGVYAYPGTPSTEITEFIQQSKEARERKVHSDWSANEKTAMESRTGDVICRQESHGLYETCGFECGCRCICECGDDRNKRGIGGGGSR